MIDYLPLQIFVYMKIKHLTNQTCLTLGEHANGVRKSNVNSDMSDFTPVLASFDFKIKMILIFNVIQLI